MFFTDMSCEMIARARRLAQSMGLDPSLVNCDIADVCENMAEPRPCLLIIRGELREEIPQEQVLTGTKIFKG